LTCAVDNKSDINLIIKNEKRKDGKKAISAVFILKADPELVYSTLRDVEKFSEFMPGSADVEILEKGTNYQEVRFSGSRGIFSADIVVRRIIDDSNKRIDWNIVTGQLREMCGYWYVERDNQRESLTIVHYNNFVDAGTLIPDFLVRKYLREDIKRMVPNIIKRVESGGTWLSNDYLKKTAQKDK
jgi:ribosome-associated toxin RatA of RatAB toxin-antitoxin module